MKILLVRTFPTVMDPNNYNSQEVGLARAFVRAGHICDIVYYCGKDPARDQVVEVPGSSQTITIHWLPGFGLLKNGFFKGLRPLLDRYDVLQAAEYDQLTSQWLYLHPGPRVVTLYHGPYQSEFTKGYNLRCRVFDWVFNRRKKNAAVACFAKSRMAAEFLRSKGFSKVESVGVGLDLDTLKAGYDPQIRPRTAAQPEFRLLYIGVLEERRNIHFLLEVLAKAAQVLPQVRLTLVGKGAPAYREDCFAHAKQLGVWDRIDYQEKVPQDQVYKLYQQANLFVLPTQYEIFGMVLLEAMFYGLPVLTSHNGGSDLLVQNGENGFVCSEFRAEDYVQVMQRLAESPEEQLRIGQAAHKTVAEEFTWDRIADRMLDVYEREWNAKAKRDL